MKKTLLLSAIMLLLCTTSFGQYATNPNKVWAFGSLAGIDFSSGSPVAITTAMNTGEGCASVADAAGSMLFYTDGKDVWDRTGTIMPHGLSIVPFFTPSSTQAALIVPVIGSTSQYYVFSLEQYSGTPGFSHLSYSIVDMTLHGGLGDVISASSGTPLASGLAEKITAVSGNSCNIWVLTHRDDSAVFWAFNVTAAGITTTPVVSSVGTFSGAHAYSIGVIKASPDRHRIVSQVWPTFGVKGTELFDFDPSSGIVSNCRLLNTTLQEYGAEFSPDNTKLYAEAFSGEIGQYDITLPTVADIIGSYTIVDPGSTFSDLKLGPDGKIYFRGASSTSLDRFNTPNASGLACGYVSAAVPLVPGTNAQLGLPNIIYSVTSGGDTTHMTHDTTTCILPTGSVVITAHDTGSATSFLWNDNVTTTDTTHISAPGTYWVTIHYGCDVVEDTINVHSHFDTVQIHQDTSMCRSFDWEYLVFTPPPGDDYVWYNGHTGTTDTFTATGDHWVHYINGCILTIDSIHANVNYNPQPIVGADTVCPGRNFIYTDPTVGGWWKSNAPAVARIDSVTGVMWGLTPGTATITYTMPTGCFIDKTITINDDPCHTGVAEVNGSGNDVPRLYPNPSAGDLTLVVNKDFFNSFQLTNSIGQVYLHDRLKRDVTVVDIHNLPVGMYYVTFNGAGHRQVLKFVRE